MAAAQGIGFRREQMGTDAKLGAGTSIAYNLIREKVPFLETAVHLSALMEEVRQLVADGTIKEAVESGPHSIE